jgi:hypothetical protein
VAMSERPQLSDTAKAAGSYVPRLRSLLSHRHYVE